MSETRKNGLDKRSEWYSTSNEDRNRKRFTITLDPKVIEAIKRAATRAVLPMSQWVEAAIKEKLDKADGKRKR